MAIYLDYNATQPLSDAAAQSLASSSTAGLAGLFGNASSSHVFGQDAKATLERARAQVAALINASPEEVSFCSGATESVNHCVKSTVFAAWRAAGKAPVRVVVTAVEHYATDRALDWLVDYGFATRVTVPVGPDGRVDAAAFAAAASGAALACCMLANNETGAVQPVAEIGALLRRGGKPPLFFCDASQAAGKVPIDVRALGADLVSLAGHKLGAPKGVGATWVRAGVALEPLLHGAGQEAGRRSGTDSVPLAAAFGAACEAARVAGVEASGLRLAALRDRLARALFSGCAPLGVTPVVHGPLGARFAVLGAAAGGGGIAAGTAPLAPLDGFLSGDAAGAAAGALPSCLPNTLYVAFPGAFAGDLMARLAGSVACSAGAACHSKAGGSAATATLSHTLQAMGVPHALGTATLRLSVGKWTSEDDVDRAAARIVAAVAAVCGLVTAPAHLLAATASTAVTPEMPPIPSGDNGSSSSNSSAPTPPTTAPLYLDDTELYSCTARVVAVLVAATDDSGKSTLLIPAHAASCGSAAAGGTTGTSWGTPVPPHTHAFVVDRTVAHPQGGGQPADRGIIAVETASSPSGVSVFEFSLVKPSTGSGAPPGALLHYGRWITALEAGQGWLDPQSPEAQAAAAAVDAAETVPAPATAATGVYVAAGASCTVHISAPSRRLAARLHSAGHLLDLAVRVRSL